MNTVESSKQILHPDISKPLFTEINGSKETEEQIYTRTTKNKLYVLYFKYL